MRPRRIIEQIKCDNLTGFGKLSEDVLGGCFKDETFVRHETHQEAVSLKLLGIAESTITNSFKLS